MEFLGAAFGDAPLLLSDFSFLSPASDEITLETAGLSLSLAGPPSVCSLFHSSKEGMRGGRLGGAGAALFGVLFAGDALGDVCCSPLVSDVVGRDRRCL